MAELLYIVLGLMKIGCLFDKCSYGTLKSRHILFTCLMIMQVCFDRITFKFQNNLVCLSYIVLCLTPLSTRLKLYCVVFNFYWLRYESSSKTVFAIVKFPIDVVSSLHPTVISYVLKTLLT
jgi:hypothetical protein